MPHLFIILRAGSFIARSSVFHPLSPKYMSTKLNRPSPPPLPREQQREFEELLRNTQTADRDAALDMHPDARRPLRAEFEGDVNPTTGEEGGPKREPVGRWGEDAGGDWSFKGRVSDF